MLLFAASILAQTPRTSTSTLKHLLAQQGFTGALEGKITIRRLGILHCGSRQLEVFYHTWEQSNPPGARHAAYRVVFLEDGNRYIGSYRVHDRPAKIVRDAILFNFSEEDGNMIRCNQDELPAEVSLDGEGEDLFK
jgi:hypothetical protein